jgi:hypothetical protein
MRSLEQLLPILLPHGAASYPTSGDCGLSHAMQGLLPLNYRTAAQGTHTLHRHRRVHLHHRVAFGAPTPRCMEHKRRSAKNPPFLKRANGSQSLAPLDLIKLLLRRGSLPSVRHRMSLLLGPISIADGDSVLLHEYMEEDMGRCNQPSRRASCHPVWQSSGRVGKAALTTIASWSGF